MTTLPLPLLNDNVKISSPSPPTVKNKIRCSVVCPFVRPHVYDCWKLLLFCSVGFLCHYLYVLPLATPPVPTIDALRQKNEITNQTKVILYSTGFFRYMVLVYIKAGSLNAQKLSV